MSEPIPIRTWTELAAIETGAEFGLSDSYILMNDLTSEDDDYEDIAGETANSGMGWEPIGKSGNEFKGTFDGNYHVISNLYIWRVEYVGLFGLNDDEAEVKNLGVINFNIAGETRAGGIVGYQHSSSIINCYAVGIMSGSTNTGGIVGYQYNSSIINCYAMVSISGGIFTGGIAGRSIASSSIINSYSTGLITGDFLLGGIAANNDGDVLNSFWNIETSGQEDSDGGTGKTTSEMKDIATYTDTSTDGLDSAWDFIGNPNDDTTNEDIWGINTYINDGYPYIKNFIKNIDEYKIIYKILAIKFDLYKQNKYYGVKYFEEARIFIVDLKKDNFNISTEVAINLLYPINKTLLHVREFFSSLPAVIKSVRAINDFVPNHFNINLNDFINSIEWENDCIPYYWVELCEASGYDTSSWNSCD